MRYSLVLLSLFLTFTSPITASSNLNQLKPISSHKSFSKQDIAGSGNNINGAGNVGVGNNNNVNGNGINGNDNDVNGNGNNVDGNDNCVDGNGNVVNGNGNVVIGNNDVVNGITNSVNGGSNVIFGNNNCVNGNGIVITANNLNIGDCVPLPLCSNIQGDPQFVGIHGQSYQVHGLPDRIFNLISTFNLQLNSKFSYLDSGYNAAQMASSRVKNMKLPITASWTHPGTYLTELGLKIDSAKINVVAGSYKDGFAALTLNGVKINVGEKIKLNKDSYIHCITRNALRVHTPIFKFKIVNSDMFFNIDNINFSELQNKISVDQISGIIGQSVDPKFKNIDNLYDFLIQDDGDIFSDQFADNRFDFNRSEDNIKITYSF
jgi:hypothetical protein